MNSRTSPAVEVRWAQLAGGVQEVEQTARDVVETLLGEIQRRVDAPTILIASHDDLGLGLAWRTMQAGAPITYVEAREKFAGLEWVGGPRPVVRIVTDRGRTIVGDPGKKRVRQRSLAGMDGDPLEGTRRRAPARINVRPGTGGLNRRVGQGAIDPTEELDSYGEIRWWPVSGGAMLGLLTLSEDGNTVLLARLSTEDRNERLVGQLAPNLALVRQFPDQLRPRYALFAVNMSGVREVRPDRAGPPPAGIDERDDMVLLDEWIAQGWVEHVVARDGDRIARDTLPGDTLLRRWQRNGVALWLATYGRRMDYQADRLQLRAMMIVSSEERENSTRRMQIAQINKGPMQGNGWLGPTRFGIVREKGTYRLSEDPVQWPWILRAFELADTSGYRRGSGLSTRRIAEQLADEGCPFDHDRLRKILRDPIYATGEFVTKVRGVPIAQRPIGLQNPVPLDRFHRVQELLALRQGRNDRTPLGEFVFSYVECVHAQCEHETNAAGRPALIKGIVKEKDSKSGCRRYRHNVFTPQQCKTGGRGPNGSHVWERDDLEPPVFEALRDLVEHPEILRQLASAAVHENAETETRLKPAQRSEIEHQIERLEVEREAASHDWVSRLAGGENSRDIDAFRRMMTTFDSRIAALQQRLVRDDEAIAESDLEDPSSSRGERVRTFLEIMTPHTPTDRQLKELRARLFQKVVHRMKIDDPGHGSITITLYGHLVPDGAALMSRDPVQACGDLLDAYRAEEDQTDDAEGNRGDTDFSGRADKSVQHRYDETAYNDVLPRPSTLKHVLAERRSLDHTGWRIRPYTAWRAPTGTPAWRLDINIDREADQS
jgi:hypothetical protein